MNQNAVLSNELHKKREAAQKVAISTLSKESEHYINKRIDVMGVVVGKEEYQLVLDDRAGQALIRLVQPVSNEIMVGNIAHVIGRFQKGDKNYVSCEVVKKVSNPLWLEVRKKEVATVVKVVEEKKDVQPQVQEKTDEKEETNHQEYLIRIIKKLDTGRGVLVDDIISQASMQNCEELIAHLIRDGEIFEVEPGRIKVLE